MHTLRVLLRKEFLQLVRNKFILIIMFQLPIIQLLILPLAATYEMKHISLSFVDNDHSSFSAKLQEKFVASGYFKLTDISPDYQRALVAIENNRADIIVEIPPDFERTVMRNQTGKVLIHANAIDGTKAGLASSYASKIVSVFNREIRQKMLPQGKYPASPVIEITYANWFNPTLHYPTFMVPGILVTLLSLVGGFLASLNIVSEKEKGTIEQINVSPVKKHTFILSKIIPFWLIGMIIFTIGLAISRWVYSILPVGSYATLYGFASIYMIALLGFGFLISTYSDNQQQAMFIAFFFMIIFILLSGEFTPISSMPNWAQKLTLANPLSYFVEVMRLVMLKGSSFRDVLPQFLSICGFGILLNSWAVIHYKKTS